MHFVTDNKMRMSFRIDVELDTLTAQKDIIGAIESENVVLFSFLENIYGYEIQYSAVFT